MSLGQKAESTDLIPSNFLSQMAHAYRLSPEQEDVLVRRFAQHQDYETIASELNTSHSACLKRMGQVYQKFGIPGNTRGKETLLHHFLVSAYQKWNDTSPVKSAIRKVAIICCGDAAESEIAQQLQQAILSQGHYAVTIEGDQQSAQNWLEQLRDAIRDSNGFALLVSAQSATSELAAEKVKLASEFQNGGDGSRPVGIAIRIQVSADCSIHNELNACLQALPQYEWESPADTTAIAKQLLQALERDSVPPSTSEHTTAGPLPRESLDGQPLPVASPELPEGQIEPESPFYIERPPIESRCREAIAQPSALVRIKGSRQTGKTSLMAKTLYEASQWNYQTVYLNLQLAERSIFESLETLLQWLCSIVSYRLQLPNQIQDYWNDFLGSKMNCTAYFEQYLLPQLETPLVLGLDELDRVFDFNLIAEDFFGLLRAWHEEGKRNTIWQQLRLVVAHSTEPYISMDINQSPFNVGLSIELREFNWNQIRELVRRYGLDWDDSAIERLMGLVGGHPYLVRISLYRIACGEFNLETLLEQAPTELGPYGDHLRRHLWHLEQQPSLWEAMQAAVTANEPIRLSSEQAFKLNSMGLVKFDGNRVLPRCKLYRQYFQDVLNA